jgi:hypothetical protein
MEWNLNINELLENNHLTVRISSGGEPLKGFLLQELSFGFASAYDTANNLTNQAIEVMRYLGGEKLSKAVSNGIGIYKVAGTHKGKNLYQTHKVWDHSDMNPIRVGFIVVENKAGEKQIAKAIAQLTHWSLGSNTGEEDDEGYLFMHAPGGYGFGDGSDDGGIKNAISGVFTSSKGTLRLEIGEQFDATGMLMTSLAYKESIARTVDGDPVYLVVEAEFVHWRTVTREDFLGWRGVTEYAIESKKEG